MLTEIGNEKPTDIPQEKYDSLVWTPHEKLFRDRKTIRNPVLAKTTVPFTISLHVKLRRSVFGTYLQDFNGNQPQNEFLNINKLCLTDTEMQNFGKIEQELFDYNNDLFDEITKYLRNAVTETEKIDCGYIHRRSNQLRLDDYHVNTLDDGLRNFQNLQVLVLCDNWISDIYGCVLPRRLKFLELYVNEIKSVKNLTNNAPTNIEYLGLGRNQLTNDSALHLLGEVGRFNNLKSLDLSECDIYCLVDVLTALMKLQNLKSLFLQGNPCSVVMGYKNIVLHYLPNLCMLDGEVVSASNIDLPENFLSDCDKAQMVFNCVKLNGLPKPPKADKKDKQTIHIEFTMPLFQENFKKFEDSDEALETNQKKETKKKTKESELSDKSSSRKSKEPKSPYAKPDEYDPQQINNFFQSERKAWNTTMKFKPVFFKSPEDNLVAYRDSFRTRVNVRIVYLKFRPPEKKTRGKNKKKGKGDKSEKSKKSSDKKNLKKDKKQKSETTESNNSSEEHAKKPEEKILKKVTLANFYCDLLSISWKKDMSFFWSEDPTFGDKAIELCTYLEKLRKEAEEKAELEAALKKEKEEKLKNKQGKGKDKKDKHKKSPAKPKKSKKSKDSKKGKKGPKFFTCQVSFGLSRFGQNLENLGSKDDVQKNDGSKKKKKKK